MPSPDTARGLRDAASKMREMVASLRGHLEWSQDYLEGDAGYSCNVVYHQEPSVYHATMYGRFDNQPGDEKNWITHENAPQSILAKIQPPGTKVTIDSWELIRSSGATYAIAQAKMLRSYVTDLESVTFQDTDDLPVLADALAESVGILQDMRKGFTDGEAQIDDLQEQAQRADWWTSDVRGDYDKTAGDQSKCFLRAKAATNAVINGNLAIMSGITDLATAIANIAEARDNRIWEQLSVLVAYLPSGWARYVTGAIDGVKAWNKAHRDDMAAGLNALVDATEATEAQWQMDDTLSQEWTKSRISLPS